MLSRVYFKATAVLIAINDVEKINMNQITERELHQARKKRAEEFGLSVDDDAFAKLEWFLAMQRPGVERVRGEPRRLTPTLKDQIVEVARRTLDFDAVTFWTGVRENTLKAWIKRGRRDTNGLYHELAAALDGDQDHPVFTFIEMLGRRSDFNIEMFARRMRQLPIEKAKQELAYLYSGFLVRIGVERQPTRFIAKNQKFQQEFDEIHNAEIRLWHREHDMAVEMARFLSREIGRIHRARWDEMKKWHDFLIREFEKLKVQTVFEAAGTLRDTYRSAGARYDDLPHLYHELRALTLQLASEAVVPDSQRKAKRKVVEIDAPSSDDDHDETGHNVYASPAPEIATIICDALTRRQLPPFEKTTDLSDDELAELREKIEQLTFVLDRFAILSKKTPHQILDLLHESGFKNLKSFAEMLGVERTKMYRALKMSTSLPSKQQS